MRDFINLVEQALVEMIIRYKSPNPEYIVAFRDSIWLLDDNTPETTYQQIEDMTGIEAHDIDSIAEFRDVRPDVLLTYYSDLPNIDGMTIALNPRTSILLKKVAHQLGLDGFTVNRMHGEEESEQHVGKYEMEGAIPRKAYHGTSSVHIMQMLKQGLRPDTEHGNWIADRSNGGMKFTDRVFLASDPEFTYYHANSAAEKTGGEPVVIELTIPDPNLIDFDYDVAIGFKGSDSDDIHHTYRDTAAGQDKGFGLDDHLPKMVAKHSPTTNYTRETGVFSYRGRIPASQFKALILSSQEGALGETEIVRETDLNRFIDFFDEFTEFQMGYDPVAFEGQRLEREEEEDEDEGNSWDLDDDDED
jgi:hypothetical protein